MLRLHTVCESVDCPNVGECWNRLSATFTIWATSARAASDSARCRNGLDTVDYDEPSRVAEAVAQFGLRHAVITSVNRDDREDGGAEVFAMVIRAMRDRLPSCTVEVLVPNFQGSRAAMDVVLKARPDVLNQNVETVSRLYRTVCIGSDCQRSLSMLRYASTRVLSTPTKSGIMVGLGETSEAIRNILEDLRDAARR